MIVERKVFYLDQATLRKYLGVGDDWEFDRAHTSDDNKFEMKVEFVRTTGRKDE